MSTMSTHDQGEQRPSDTLRRLFHPGPLAWLLRLTEPKQRFHPGAHLHGLEDHDVPSPADGGPFGPASARRRD